MTEYLLVNFGGPRSSSEIEPFLQALLCDRDVIHTRFPPFLHNWLFRRVAKKRASLIAHDYARIGGHSPIFFDTEALAKALSDQLKAPVHTFHRYLPATHAYSLQKLEASSAAQIRVLPLFPQFSFSTTGSIARFFGKYLRRKTIAKLHWIRSYSNHPAFVSSFQQRIRQFLAQNCLLEAETVLLFSAHGLPASYVAKGDPYQSECERSFHAIRSAFPHALIRLSYQSKFGPGEWLRPSTEEVSQNILDWCEGRSHIVFIPLSFTSDHIETLFEIEFQYLPLVRAHYLNAYRCPALNLESHWIAALEQLFCEGANAKNKELIRQKFRIAKSF